MLSRDLIIEMVVEVKRSNHINILILVRLNPLTDGNMGILANEYSSLRLIARA